MPMSPRLLRPIAGRPAAPPAFSPSSIANLSLWLDANDTATLFDATEGGSHVIADGAVARWDDKAADNYQVTQATANNRPLLRTSGINGKPAIEFDGVDDWLQIEQNLIGNGGDMTVLVAMQIDTLHGGTRLILNKGDAATFENTVWELEAGTPWYGYANGAWYASSGTSPLPTSTPMVVGGRTEGFVSTLLMNNSPAGPDSNSADAANDISQHIGICGSGMSGADPLAATIGEILIYERALTSSEMGELHAYLAGKWGVA